MQCGQTYDTGYDFMVKEMQAKIVGIVEVQMNSEDNA